HGQWGVYLLMKSLGLKLPGAGRTLISAIYNEDGINNTVDPVIAGWMADEKVPLVMLSTTKTALDKKGGQIGVAHAEDGTVRKDMLELAQAKKNGQEQLFYDMGLAEGEAGAQYFNTNTVLANHSVLVPFLRELSDLIGMDEFIKIIGPSLIKNAKTKGKASYIQLEGALGSVLLNLDGYLSTTKDERVAALMAKHGIKKLVRIVNIDEKNRTRFFTPVKSAFDFWLLFNSDLFKRMNPETWELESDRPGFIPAVNLADGYYADVANVNDAFGHASTLGLDALDIAGKVHLKDAVLWGKVKIENKTNDIFDLNDDSTLQYLGLEKTPDGRVILDNVTISVDEEGLPKLTRVGPRRPASEPVAPIEAGETELDAGQLVRETIHAAVVPGKLDEAVARTISGILAQREKEADFEPVASVDVPKHIRDIYKDPVIRMAKGESTEGLESRYAFENDVTTLEVGTPAEWVSFGTSGDRGKVGEKFVPQHVMRLAQGIADYYHTNGLKGPIVVGYDNRLLAREYGHLVASVLAANGIEVQLSAEAVPVPVVAYAVASAKGSSREKAGAIVITASHNPWHDIGLKWCPSHGGAAPSAITEVIQASARKVTEAKFTTLTRAMAKGTVRFVDLKPGYVEYVIDTLPEKAQAAIQEWGRNPDHRVIVDPMHGAAIGYLSTLMGALGVGYREDHETIDRMFADIGGKPNPDSIAMYDEEIGKAKKDGEEVLRLAVDGDADRFGVVDITGEKLSANQLIPLFAYFLNKEGYEGGIAKTLPTSDLSNGVAKLLGVDIREVATGFKNFVGLLDTGKFLSAGEESAHVGVSVFKESWDDGVAVNLMALWIVAQTGKSLTDNIREMEAKIGSHYEYGRVDLRIEDAAEMDKIKAALDLGAAAALVQGQDGEIEYAYGGEELGMPFFGALKDGVGAQNGGVAKIIVSYDKDKKKSDGYKVVFNNNSWICVRVSGTEPVVRVYGEVVNACTEANWDKVRSESFNQLNGVLLQDTQKALGVSKPGSLKPPFYAQEKKATAETPAVEDEEILEEADVEPVASVEVPKHIRDIYKDPIIQMAKGKSTEGLESRYAFENDVTTLEVGTPAEWVSFGTSGDRGKVGEKFVPQHVMRLAQGIADYYRSARLKGPIVVGYDNRLLAREYGYLVASVLAANGIEAELSPEAVPVPVAAYAAASTLGTVNEKAGVIVITASHNPWHDIGLKWCPSHGGAAPSAITEMIQASARKVTEAKFTTLTRAMVKGKVRFVNLKPAYDKYVLATLPEKAQAAIQEWGRNPDHRVIVDPMHGAAIGYLSTLMGALGVGYREDHETIDRMFADIGGKPNPDSIAMYDEEIGKAKK
ncbi:MAG: UTP--glucose-1-phosphate uridylyltransferase, partial [Endomicrobiales bacterium]